MAERYDVVVVGSGPNGLAAAITLARQGLSTLVVEKHSTFGGGMRSGTGLYPGVVHDLCSAVHPLGIGSPLFAELELEQHGLQWVHPKAPLAHIMPDGSAVMLERSLSATAAQFGRDARAYEELLGPFVEHFDDLIGMVLAPLRRPASPVLLGRFGLQAVRSLQGVVRRFESEAPKALLAGISAHAMVPLEDLVSASFGLVLAMAGHAVGWPVARGGSQSIADALVSKLRSLGGELVLDREVHTLDELPPARAYVLDVSPRHLLRIAGDRLSSGYRRRLERFRYGPGVFKMDWVLREPIPWKDPNTLRANTVHLSGTFHDISRAQHEAHRGEISRFPFILLGQPSLFDSTRAPAGTHVVWAYSHVPHGSTADATEAMESHIERFAPGFRDLVLAREATDTVGIEAHSPNFVGGDINGGIADARQLFFRPAPRADPYATSASNVFLCSSSTPPGGGVHGMCGYWAARRVAARVFGLRIAERRRALPTAAPRAASQAR